MSPHERLHASVEHVVPFHDCDPLGIVWHGNYYKYFEMARTELLAPRGLEGPALLETGYRLFVVQSSCKHLAPLRYRDRVRITATLIDQDVRLNVGFEVARLGDTAKVCATGKTVLAAVDADHELQFELPPALRERLAP